MTPEEIATARWEFQVTDALCIVAGAQHAILRSLAGGFLESGWRGAAMDLQAMGRRLQFLLEERPERLR